MKLLKKLMLLSIVIPMLSGCGTLLALSFSPTYDPYEGVKESVGAGGILLLDVPFSFIADTLLLPVAIYDQSY